MRGTQRWQALAAVLLLLAAGGTAARAEEFVITSFDGTGRLGWNETTVATNYRVEWACSPAGPWTNFAAAATALDSVPPTGTGSVWRSVPMCYRVVAMVTNGWPEIELVGDLAFGDVGVGTTVTRTLRILNRGVLSLHVTGIAYPEGFSGAWSGTVPGGESVDVTVTFAPAALAAYGGLVSVTSDSQGGTATRAISGTGIAVTYLVVDLSGGPSAVSYPVSYLGAVPPGGWADEHKTTKLVLRRIPATTPDFTMGSPTNELGRYSAETQHQVTLSSDFYVGVFEVTQRQWDLVMGDTPSYFNNPAYYETRSVETVSYYDIRENPANSDDPAADWPANATVNANSFMGRLRAKTGLAGFDLPTESQWEYACRGGTTTALNSGYDLTSTGSDPRMSEVGRYWYNGGSSYTEDCAPSEGTATVGSYLPNAWGLYDMHGNVWEWCLDWHGTYPATVTDPPGATLGAGRVIRGGSWVSGASYCRSAGRFYYGPDTRDAVIGFRVARTLP